MTESIGFIGLGALGFPIAANLMSAGYPLRVYNRTASKAEPLVASGAQQVQKAADTVIRGGVVVSVIWDDEALESVVSSDDFLPRLGKGGVHISMSTVSPAAARRVAALHAAQGCEYVEAPIFGRPEAAVARKLVIPIAGSPRGKERARPILEAMGGSAIFDFGEHAGAAVSVKLAGNFMIISAARTMAEAVSMAEKSGADPKSVIAMLTTTLFSAPIYQSYGKQLADKVPMLQSDIPRKDVGLFTRTAGEVSSPAPIATALEAILRTPST